MNANLLIKREERVLRLTLNRPEKRNALDSALCEALVAAMEQAGSDHAIGAILIDSVGEVFSAGMDLDEALGPAGHELTAIHERLFTAGEWLTKPLVTGVRGPALAGAMGLVANSHVALAAQGSTFGLTEIRIGMWPFVVYRSIVEAVGSRRAQELSLTGRLFSAQEALQWGLIHQVAPAIEFEERASHLAKLLSNASPGVVAMGMEFGRRSRGVPSDEAGRMALEYRRRAFESADFAEGVRAFKEKRTPIWPSLAPPAAS